MEGVTPRFLPRILSLAFASTVSSGSGFGCGCLVARENGNASGGMDRAAAAAGQKLPQAGSGAVSGKKRGQLGRGGSRDGPGSSL